MVEAVRAGTLRLVWSEPTRKETKALLSRIPPTSWEAVAELFQEENRRSIEFETTAFATVKDPEDRKFAALATSADAVLLTLDRHLLAADLDDTCVVRTPSAFLEGWE